MIVFEDEHSSRSSFFFFLLCALHALSRITFPTADRTETVKMYWADMHVVLFADGLHLSANISPGLEGLLEYVGHRNVGGDATRKEVRAIFYYQSILRLFVLPRRKNPVHFTEENLPGDIPKSKGTKRNNIAVYCRWSLCGPLILTAETTWSSG